MNTQLTTLPSLVLPALPGLLNGAVGRNRQSDGSSQLHSANDREAIIAWLANVADSDHTRSSYMREIDRLYRWAASERGTVISDLKHEDFILYRAFLANPQPTAMWVSAKRHPRGHPDWRPFSGPLSESSIKLSMSIINALFSWLVEARYLVANPLALSRKKRSGGKRRITRLLSQDQVAEVFEAIERLPRLTLADVRTYRRNRWLLSLGLLTGLRASEIVSSTMGQIYSLPAKEGGVCWFIEVLGKGSKYRQIPINSELLEELRTYRESLGLPAFPTPRESLPLVAKVKTCDKGQIDPTPMTRQAAHKILKGLFAQAADEMRLQGRHAEASALDEASTHWLRHTAASMMASSGQDIHMIKDTLGHADLSTTSNYVHTELTARHGEMEKLSIRKKSSENE